MSATDSESIFRFGENKHIEYNWSQQIREKIIQLHFQLVRTNDPSKIATIYKSAINDTMLSNNIKTEYALILYKMIAQTRDIIAGKGEYLLAHVLIAEWACLLDDDFENNPPKSRSLLRGSKARVKAQENSYKKQQAIKQLVNHALLSLVNLGEDCHPLGSWKDVKYFLNYWIKRRNWDPIKDFSTIKENYVVKFLVDISVQQLRRENALPEGENETLIARWIPNETSKKFGWQTKLFAMAYYPEWMQTTAQSNNPKKAINKCLTHFRKMKSALNRRLNTPQINQCAKTWANIDFDNDVTSITLSKQRHAFQKLNNKTHYDVDRNQCAENYSSYLKRCQEGTSIAKGARVSMVDFVSAACTQTNQSDIDMINMQWNNNADNTNSLDEMLAIIDTSASMMDPKMEPLYNAIGLGIRIAEKSSFGRRAITFSSTPEWIVYDNNDTFTDMVSKTLGTNMGSSTNIGAAMRMILQAATDNNLMPSQMVKVLVILSDMQIDKDTWGIKVNHNFDPVLVNEIENEFRCARCAAAPNGYDMPKVIFWNLRSTNGFPCGNYKKNVFMMSGCNPATLNLFSEKGLSALENMNPYDTLKHSLNHGRYKSFEDIFMKHVVKL